MIRVSNSSSVPMELVSLRSNVIVGTVEPRSSLTVPDDGNGYYLRIPEYARQSIVGPGENWIFSASRRAQLIQRYCAP